jgi:AraC-like DNA-binding protein
LKKHQIDIPVFPISPLSQAGIFIKNMSSGDGGWEHENSKPHRDDHYIMMLAESGDFIINIDFQEVVIKGPATLIIFPGQVHYMVSASKASGWVVSFDPAVIDNEFQMVIEKNHHLSLFLNDQSDFYKHGSVLMDQLEKLQLQEGNSFKTEISQLLLNTFLGYLSAEIEGIAQTEVRKEGRGAIISYKFIQLLKNNYKLNKKPAWYASMLNITTAHLYDVVKNTTGTSVSGYIQQYSILEAKRLLYFTSFTVKEIAYQLGYEEPVYFGKLFKKITGSTPLEFRKGVAKKRQ